MQSCGYSKDPTLRVQPGKYDMVDKKSAPKIAVNSFIVERHKEEEDDGEKQRRQEEKKKKGVRRVAMTMMIILLLSVWVESEYWHFDYVIASRLTRSFVKSRMHLLPPSKMGTKDNVASNVLMKRKGSY